MSINYIGMGLGFGWKLGGTSGPVIGPITHIAQTPSTATPAHNATGTITSAYPEDEADAHTGARVWYVSTDPAIVRVDDVDTGAWTFLGTTGQQASIYSRLTAPPASGDAAIEYDPSLHDMIFAPGMSGWTSWDDALAAGMHSIDAGAPNNGADDGDGHNSIQSDGGGPFARIAFTGDLNEGGTNEARLISVSWAGDRAEIPAYSGAGSAGRAVHVRFEFRWHETTMPLDDGAFAHVIAYKCMELYHTYNQSRAQNNTTWLQAGRGTNYIPYSPTTTPAYVPGTSYPLFEFASGRATTTNQQSSQVAGPWLHEAIVEQWGQMDWQYQTHTPNAGTVDLLLQSGDMVFAFDQTGILANGDYIAIPESTAEFQISNFVAANGASGNLSTATITRSPTTGNTPFVSYTQGWSHVYGLTTVHHGTCSTSQAGEPTLANGAYLQFRSTAAYESAYPHTISAFDGTTGFTLTSVLNSSMYGDGLGITYSTLMDGHSLLFMNGVLIVACAKRYAGVENPGNQTGSPQAWTDIIDVACVNVDDPTYKLVLAANIQGIRPHDSEYKNIQIFADKP